MALPVGDKMFNRDKRSLALTLILGDGCLHLTSNKYSGAITIDHGIDQIDYQEWKAELLSYIFDRKVKVRQGHKGKSAQVSVAAKRLKAWRKFCYKNNKKNIPRILKFINNPELAIAVMLMDDGYIEPSIFNKELKGARYRLFLCDQTPEDLELIQEWIKDNFGTDTKIRFQNTRGKRYPFIVWKQKESLEIWTKIREFVLKFESMKHKFRHMEEFYQISILQRVLDDKKVIE